MSGRLCVKARRPVYHTTPQLLTSESPYRVRQSLHRTINILFVLTHPRSLSSWYRLAWSWPIIHISS